MADPAEAAVPKTHVLRGESAAQHGAGEAEVPQPVSKGPRGGESAQSHRAASPVPEAPVAARGGSATSRPSPEGVPAALSSCAAPCHRRPGRSPPPCRRAATPPPAGMEQNNFWAGAVICLREKDSDRANDTYLGGRGEGGPQRSLHTGDIKRRNAFGGEMQPLHRSVAA